MGSYPSAFTDRTVGEGFGDYVSVISWIPSGFRNAVYYGMPQWQAMAAYSAGVGVLDPSNHVQLCTTPGTSGGSTPPWNDSGGSTTDGGVTWQDQGYYDLSSYIQAAINALQPGQRLWFPHGTYPLAGSGTAILTIQQPVSVSAEHLGDVILLVDAGVPNTRDVLYFKSSALAGGINNMRFEKLSVQSTLGSSISITAAAGYGSPPSGIEITVGTANPWASGQVVVISGGVAGMNGKHVVTKIDSTHYTLSNSYPFGPPIPALGTSYSSGAIARAVPARHAWAFDITNPVSYCVFHQVQFSAANSIGGQSVCTLPSNPPALNGNFFKNDFYSCRFGDGALFNYAGDSLSFFGLETSGDNVGVVLNLVNGADAPAFFGLNSVSSRGAVSLVCGDTFKLEMPNIESDAATGYPQPAMVSLGQQDAGPIAATCSTAIVGSATPQAITLSNVTNIVPGQMIRLSDPLVSSIYGNFYVESIAGLNVTGVFLLSIPNTPVQVSNARVNQPTVTGGGQITCNNSQIPVAVKFDYADRGSIDEVALGIGIGGNTPLLLLTANQTSTQIGQRLKLFGGNLPWRLVLDQSSPTQQNPSVLALQVAALLNSGLCRDSAGAAQASSFTSPLGGALGWVQALNPFSRAPDVIGSRVDITVNTPTTAPDKTNTAWIIEEGTDGAPTAHYWGTGIGKAGAAQDYVFAFYAQASARAAAYAQMYSTLGGTAYAHFDLTGTYQPQFGSSGGFSNAQACMIRDPRWDAGWYLCVLIATSDTDTVLDYLIGPEAVLGTLNYQGNGSNAINIWDYNIQEGRSLLPVAYTNGSTIGEAGAPLNGLYAQIARVFNAIFLGGSAGPGFGGVEPLSFNAPGYPPANTNVIRTVNNASGSGFSFECDNSAGGAPSWLPLLQLLSSSGVIFPQLVGGGIAHVQASTGLLLVSTLSALGGLLAANNLSDIANGPAALANLNGATKGNPATFSLTANLTTGAVTGSITQT